MDTSHTNSEKLQSGLLQPAALIDALLIRPGMNVADFGCGGGHFTFMLAKKVGENGKVYALDVQATPLDMVKERARVEGVENIQTIRANLETPGSSTLADGSQDLVLVANILFQSPKKSEIIKEAKRILKPQGRLVLIEWRKGTGGFGPPDDLRMDEETIHTLVRQEGMKAGEDLHIGEFHHIMTFTH
ncbi:MAG: methyltransferase domain-containing protein [Patescibacteria group bacterium]